MGKKKSSSRTQSARRQTSKRTNSTGGTAILCTLFLFFKFFVCSIYWGRKRAAAGLRAPEDKQAREPTQQAVLLFSALCFFSLNSLFVPFIGEEKEQQQDSERQKTNKQENQLNRRYCYSLHSVSFL